MPDGGREECDECHAGCGGQDLVFKQPINVIASGAKQSIVPRKERMDCFAPLAMTDEYESAFSPHVLREVCPFRSALPKEGAGNAGRSMRP
jgi:hypothetical protein